MATKKKKVRVRAASSDPKPTDEPPRKVSETIFSRIEPVEETEPEPEAPAVVEESKLDLPAKPAAKAATAAPTLPKGVVRGRAAVDPTRRRNTKPRLIACYVYCGVAGIRDEHAAGFINWALRHGHQEHSREKWDELHETYKNTPVTR